MGFLEIIIIAAALSMDTFAVSICLGLSVKKPRPLDFLIPGLYFGFFQALMPCIGYFAGTHFAGKAQHWDHWIAFILLGIIGGKMIKESLSKDCCGERIENYASQFLKMFLLAVATSIDALAVGVTFAFFEVRLFTSIAIIGFTTFFVSILGVKIGNVFGEKYKAKAEFCGGAVLVLLGVKILAEHLFF